MQTFLPYPDFKDSAECLDKKRCWKQVLETSQILKCLKLTREGSTTHGWRNHPAVLMWKNYESALVDYYNAFWEVSVNKWKVKVNKLQKMEKISFPGCLGLPIWFGYDRIHSSHRGRLLAKDFEYYSQFGWKEKPISESDGYFWPVKLDGNLDEDVLSWVTSTHPYV